MQTLFFAHRLAGVSNMKRLMIAGTIGSAVLVLSVPASASLVIYDDGTGNDASIPEGGWSTTWQTRTQDENVHTGSFALHTRQDQAASPGQFRFNHDGLDAGANTILEFYMNKDVLSIAHANHQVPEPVARNLSVEIDYRNAADELFTIRFSGAGHVYLIDGVASAPGFGPDEDPQTWQHVQLDLTQASADGTRQFDPTAHVLTRIHFAPWGFSFSSDNVHLLLDDIRLVPEPASMALLAGGGLLLATRRRRAA